MNEVSPGHGLRLFPDRSLFVELAKSHRLVPVTTEIIADALTPVSVFEALVGTEKGFLLESVEGGERWGRYSFVGRSPLATLTARGRSIAVEGNIDIPTGCDGVLSLLEALLGAYHSPALEQLPPLHAGLVGFLSYDVVREIERLEEVPFDDQGHPEAVLYVIGQLAAFDHWRQVVVLVDNVAIDAEWGENEIEVAYDEAVVRLDQLAADCVTRGPTRPQAAPAKTTEAVVANRTMSSDAYIDAIAVAKDYITAGDIFQVVLSQRFDFTLEADPFDVYRCLRLLNPSPYLYFLRFDALCVVGTSPEPMVRLRDGTVISRPIAGSRPRGRTEAEDRRLGAELSEDPKEVAEHVMLVDLARNDVGRVVSFGTEKVDEMMSVEPYSHIMHLTSQVSGQLAPGKGPIDVLRATLPAGTLSGAPKVRAMEIIDELEPTKRGVYGGVVGYIDFSGNLDTAIAIRTMVVMADGRASVQAGAGIVADSDPRSEDEECQHKAAAILHAVAAAQSMNSMSS